VTTPLTLTASLPVQRRGRGRRTELHPGPPPPPRPLPAGRVPRVARLMALAMRLEQLLQTGVVADAAALARLGHVSRARITQILNLRLLAPDLQETLLCLPRTEHGRDPIVLRDLQPITAVLDWSEQRRRWQQCRMGSPGGGASKSTTSSPKALALATPAR
jgi:integrase